MELYCEECGEGYVPDEITAKSHMCESCSWDVFIGALERACNAHEGDLIPLTPKAD
jgi:uncharacterized protein (DUF983 family)